MSYTTLSRMVCLCSLLIGGVSVEAQQSPTASSYVIPGSACQPMNFSQARNLEWRARGAVNDHPILDRWVVCPIIKFDSSAKVDVSVSFYNEAPDIASVLCRFQEFDAGDLKNNQIATVDIAPSTPSSTSPSIRFQESVLPSSQISIACRLPPGMVVESLASREMIASTVAQPPNVWACATSPDSDAADTECVATTPGVNYGPSDPVVCMKNGAMLKNYDGRTWGDEDDHIIFQVEQPSNYPERWFTYQNGIGLYRVQIHSKYDPNTMFQPQPQYPPSLTNPDCLAPDFSQITHREQNLCGDTRVVWWDGSANIDKECPFNVGSHLYFFSTQGQGTTDFVSLDPNAADGAIDLLTGKQCDFIFYEEDPECSE